MNGERLQKYLANAGIASRRKCEELILEGTKPIKENFQHFILTENGIKLIFPRYQIAPYYQGEFELVIPYKELKK